MRNNSFKGKSNYFKKPPFRRNNNNNRSENNYFNKQRDFGPNKNQYIRATQVLLITETGDNIGVVATTDALQRAKDAGLDLVEIGASANPPVCKIMDYSKFLYEKNKKDRKSKKIGKMKEIKELKFSPVIEGHDIEVRVARAKDFMEKGHNVKLTVQRKGRQTREQSREIMRQLLTIFSDYSTIEPEPKEDGPKLSITIKADGKTKNKQNSKKEDKVEQPEGEQEKQNALQENSSTPFKDKIIQQIKAKEAAKRGS